MNAALSRRELLAGVAATIAAAGEFAILLIYQEPKCEIRCPDLCRYELGNR
jgi:hypothetical protein